MKPEILRNGNIRISIPVTFKTQGGRKRIAAKETTDLPGCDSPLQVSAQRDTSFPETNRVLNYL